MRKWYSLIDKVYSLKNLKASYKTLRGNKGSKTVCIDGIDIKTFGAHLRENLCHLSEELKSGTYRPQAVKRVYIDKSDCSKRSLGIATIRDRIVQQSLVNVLSPIFEPTFHPSSYGYRPGRSAHQAMAKAERFTRHYHLSHVADMDLSKCFDTLDHELILSGVNDYVSDGKVLSLIKLLITSEVCDHGNYEPTTKGSPQGSILSPLLTNIYLNKFDQYMKGNNIRIVRYADDILVFAPSKSLAGKYMAIATDFLENELKLKVNEKKSKLTSLSEGIHYLGFVLRTRGVIVSQKSIRNFKEKVRLLTRRNSGKKIYYSINKLNELLRGFTNYFRIAQSQSLFRELMSWIRRRIRMMIMKQWKGWKALHKQLRRMGYKGSFGKISVTRWRNSSCQLIHMALPNAWLKRLGLYPMDEVPTNTLHQYFDIVLNKI